MKSFEPILSDQPLTLALNNATCFRNKAREEEWGAPVYFSPYEKPFDAVGIPGAYYKYGYNASALKGVYGNCTWWVYGRHRMNSGEKLACVIGNAVNSFDKYNGRKDGSLTERIYIGDTIQKGDAIVYSDDLTKNCDGHINYVEKVEGNTIYISESGYSTKSCYKDKACIVYTLDKTLFYTTDKISLRPQKPYSEYIYGVIHTGDCYDKESIDYETKYSEILSDMKKIKEIANKYE